MPCENRRLLLSICKQLYVSAVLTADTDATPAPGQLYALDGQLEIREGVGSPAEERWIAEGEPDVLRPG